MWDILLFITVTVVMFYTFLYAVKSIGYLKGETKTIENSEISTPVPGSEWEDALEKPQITTEESCEDVYTEQSTQQKSDKKHYSNLQKDTTDSSFQSKETLSHSENAELDTEISYCNFITNYTIEKTFSETEEKTIETTEFVIENKNDKIELLENTEDVINRSCEIVEKSTTDRIEKQCDALNPELEAAELVSKAYCNDTNEPKIIISENTCTYEKGANDVSEKTNEIESANGQRSVVTKTEIQVHVGIKKDISEHINYNGKKTYHDTSETEECPHNQDANTEKDVHEKIFNAQNTESLISLGNISLESAVDDDSCDLNKIDKFTAASCDLVSIVQALYKIKENVAYQANFLSDPDEDFESKFFILSKGAFCEHPEGFYLIKIENSILHITETLPNSPILFSLNMKYVEITSDAADGILKIDDRMGRCLYVKCDSGLLFEMKDDLEKHCRKHWKKDCLQLVSFPLKCHQNVVIINIGSCSTRAGVLMDSPTLPTLFFPTICAIDKRTGGCVYGMEALQPEVRQYSTLSFPARPTNKITKHTVDINLMGGLFKKIFCDLKIDQTQYTIQVCLPRNLSISTQTALLKLLLEDLKVKAVSLVNQSLLTLYAHEVSTGVVVDIGDRTDVVPVVDGFIVENGVTRLPHGGQRLIHHMKHGLAEKRISLSSDIDSFVVQYILENVAYVAEDYDKEMQIISRHPDIISKTVILPPALSENQHSKSITLEEACFKVPEGLFNPDLWGVDSPGIHHLVQKAIQATGVDVRKQIAENIYVSGGVTMLPGFVERLNKEVSKLSKAKVIPKVNASNYRYHCSFIGACKFAKMEVFPQVCINLEEYKTDGASALKKCALYF